jgi:MFS family permease
VTPPTQRATWPALREVLASAGYRRLLGTRLASQAGDGAFQVGLASLVFFSPERAATTAAVAWAFTAALVPYTVVGPFAGVLLDRWQRRQVLLVANLVRAVLVLVVAWVVVAVGVGPLLYVLVLVCLSVNRFFLAGLSAGLPHVVRADDLVVANAVTPTAGTVAALLGGAGGYAVRSRLGVGDTSDAVVLVCAAGLYLVSAAVVVSLGRAALGPDGGPAPGRLGAQLASVARGLVAGARHVRERRAAFDALAVIGSLRTGFGLFTLTTVLLCRNTLTDPADVDAGLALVASAFAAAGVGAGLAAVLTPPATRALGLRTWMVGALAAAAVVEVVFAVGVTVPVLVAGSFVLGLAAQAVKIGVDTVVQTSVDDTFRGRVFTFYDTVFNAAFLLAAVVAVLAVPASGDQPWVFAAVAVLLAGTAAAYARRP